MVEVTGRELRNAARVFAKAYGNGHANAAFNKLFGIPYLLDHVTYGLTKVEVERIKMLNGERGHFYAKIMIARKWEE
jgi:hypothetical protein